MLSLLLLYARTVATMDAIIARIAITSEAFIGIGAAHSAFQDLF
jgi:hypothetical protein